MNKEKLFIILVLIVHLLFSIFISSRPIVHDDQIFANISLHKSFFNEINTHPPVSNWLDIFFTSIFGNNNTALRMTSIVFSTLTIFLVFIITKRFYNQKVAVYSTLTITFWAWHIRASQMNSNSDGGLFTFLFLLSTYLFLRYEQNKEIKFLFFTGLSIGITALVREIGILLILCILIYYLVNYRKEYFFAFKNSFYIGIIAIIPIIIFLILDLIFNNFQLSINTFNRTFTTLLNPQSINTVASPLTTRIFSYFKIIFWAGLTTLGGVILYLLNYPDRERWKNIFFIELLIFGIIYLFLLNPALNIVRYLMIFIPLLSIYFGMFLSSIDFKRRDLFFMVLIAIFLFLSFIFINTFITTLSFNNIPLFKELLTKDILSLGLPFFDETDNSGFVINFFNIMAFLILSLLLLIYLTFSFKNRINNKYVKIGILFFLGAGLAFNFFIISEYAFHVTGPDYGEGIENLINYAQKNKLNEPLIIIKNYELLYYLRNDYKVYVTQFGISDKEGTKIASFMEYLENNGGTIIFTDMPPLDKGGLLWKAINKCNQKFTFQDKGFKIAYIYDCSLLKK